MDAFPKSKIRCQLFDESGVTQASKAMLGWEETMPSGRERYAEMVLADWLPLVVPGRTSELPESAPPLPRTTAVSPVAASAKAVPAGAGASGPSNDQRYSGTGTGGSGSGGRTVASGPAWRLASTSAGVSAWS